MKEQKENEEITATYTLQKVKETRQQIQDALQRSELPLSICVGLLEQIKFESFYMIYASEKRLER